MIDVSRTIGSSVLALFVLGCGPTPDEVTSAAVPTGETATSTGSTETLPTTDASATVASADGTGTSEGQATTLHFDSGATTMVEGSATSGSSGDPGTSSSGMMEGSSSGEQDSCHPILAEILYDPMGMNNNKQWVKLYNPCAYDIDMADASLGWGGIDYAANGLDLQGTIAAGRCFLLGGPTVSADTYDPVYDWPVDLSGDLEVSGNPADGVALFGDIEANILPDTVPVDAVIYGNDNGSNLLDAEGDTPAPHVGDAGSTESIRRTGLASTTWVIEPNPTPNECPTLL